MLRLRPYKKYDAQRIVSWIKDEVSFRRWCADRYESYPITAMDMTEHYAQTEYTDNLFPFTAFDESGIAGHLIMRFTDADKKVLRFGFIVVDDTKRGMGYGREMLQLALRYAFDILRVDKVTLGVFENNPAAYRCYTSVGFKDVTSDTPEYYHVLGEDWKCLELEMTEKEYHL